jgi:hypothetical protein
MGTDLKEINDVRAILHELLPLVDQAEDKFKNARNWGVVDLLGGGLITDLIKHSQPGSASRITDRLSYEHRRFCNICRFCL